MDLLARMQGSLGYVLHVVPRKGLAGREVSSSAVRRTLKEGNVREANLLLGRPYAIGGKVSHGKTLGRTLGFPTANLLPGGVKLLPKYGVYAAYAHFEGRRYGAVCSIGVNPTVGSDAPVLEAHLIGFDGDAYDKALRVHFVAHIRDEQKFDSLDALKKQIAQDLCEAQRILQL